MGFLFSSPNKAQKNQQVTKSKLQNVDMVKVKLKQARDRINQFINMKQKDLDEINKKIKQHISNMGQSQQIDKKKVLPLLSARKQYQKLIQNAQIRLKAVKNSLTQVQMNQMTKQTVDALDISNKYIQQIQTQLQKKDWKNVIQQASRKYQIQYPQQENIEDDETFKQLWKQIGGEKFDKEVKKKKINVEIKNKQQQKQKSNKINMQLA